ncbi:MAG: hypothetical protein PHC98_00010 [Syntrophotalea acetylenica]|nr:hypothetical protein [Syntrophotalea acetylenica]MDL2313700.1 hypothetical protein [Desulfovibrio sp. OttesenSCG-928-C14]
MNDRHRKQQQITVLACEKLGQKFISSMLDLCEKRIFAENSPNTNAMAHAAMNAKYAIEIFLLLSHLDSE